MSRLFFTFFFLSLYWNGCRIPARGACLGYRCKSQIVIPPAFSAGIGPFIFIQPGHYLSLVVMCKNVTHFILQSCPVNKKVPIFNKKIGTIVFMYSTHRVYISVLTGKSVSLLIRVMEATLRFLRPYPTFPMGNKMPKSG